MTLKDLKNIVDELEKLVKKQNIDLENIDIVFAGDLMMIYLPGKMHKIQINESITT